MIRFCNHNFVATKSNLKKKQQEKDMDEEGGARFKEIAKVYRGPEGGKPVFKTWRDAREINPAITLNEVRVWFKQNVQPKGQVWGKRNSYVAPGPYHEYQADLIFITPGQFPEA
jgi:hypothetical protein